MPKVGKMKFPYTTKGKIQAKAYAKRIGKKMMGKGRKRHKMGYDFRKAEKKLGIVH